MRVARRTAVLASGLRPGERRLLELVIEHPGQVRAWYAQAYGVSPNTMSCYLDILKSAGVIYATGRGPSCKWLPGKKPEAVVVPINSVWMLAA